MYYQTTTSLPPETMQLRDQLLDALPYLSDTVMVNAAEKEDVLPNSIVTEILAENPQAAKSEKVLNTLDARTNPLNDNQMAQIHANDTVLGNKESLESKLAFYRVEKARNTTELIRLFQQDKAINAKPDSIENTLSNINSPGSKYLQAFCRYNKVDSTGVLNILNDVTSDFDLNSYENNIHTAYDDYFNLLLTLKSANKVVTEVDSAQKSTLSNIVQNASGLVQALARNILIKTGDIIYNEPYILTDTTTTKSARVIGSFGKSGNVKESYIKLYPNPAKDYITIEYNIPLNAEKAVVEIVSITGVQKEAIRLTTGWGEKIIDLRNYKPGTYFVRLYLAGKVIDNRKFVKF